MEKYIKIFLKSFKRLVALSNSLIINFFSRFNQNFFKKTSTNVSIFNKILITFITTLFCYLFFLTLPNLYDKSWVQKTLKSKLTEEFKVNFSLSSEISYAILPSPHFIIQNVTIFNDLSKNQKIADIKKLKIFISQKKFLNKNNIFIKDILIEEANFIFNKDNFNYLRDFINYKFNKKKINIKKSNIFFQDESKETLLIIKLSSANLFYEGKKLLNQIMIKGKIFNVPFSLNLNKNLISKSLKSDFKAKKLKLKFKDTLNTIDNTISGYTELSILNNNLFYRYNLENNKIIFKSQNSTPPNNLIEYQAEINLKPFDFFLNIDLKKMHIKNFLNKESIIFELIRSEIFFNENLNLLIDLNSSIIQEYKNLKDLKIKFKIDQGEINLNGSQLLFNKIGSIKLKKSIFSLNEKELILKGDLHFEDINSSQFFKFIQLSKNKRLENMNSVIISFNYDFLSEKLSLTDFIIDDLKPSREILNILDNFNLKKNPNIIYFRNILNKIFSDYLG
jgi:hypothetical protein